MFNQKVIIFIKFIVIYLINFSESKEKINCVIPNQNSTANCIQKELCPTYLRTIQSRPLLSEKINFLKKVQCNSDDGETLVCCPQNDIYRNPSIPVPMGQRRKFRRPILISENIESGELITRFGDSDTLNLLPTSSQCGLQIENRIIGGEITEIDEFPWMALLIYNSKKKNGFEFGCGGVLITHRYVLTAAHCVMGEQYLAKGGLKSVRLGEYNTETELDCIQEGSEYDCADYPVDSMVEQIIPHPNYNSSDWNKYNDIALLRLDRNINFTDFIRPICLPSDTFNSELSPGTFLSICGWGKTDLFREHRGYIQSIIKLKLKLPIVDKNVCSRAFIPQRLVIGESQVCAGGEKSRDSCPGDSGSPLMFFDRRTVRWIVAGVVSLGLNECGTLNVPGVYTNVHSYLGWIRETIEP